MRKFDTRVQELKYKVLKTVSKEYWDGTLQKNYYEIPKMIVPGPKPSMRCCIYKERAIAADRVKLALGGNEADPNIIEVIEAACEECPFGGTEVTDLCRGCLAHRCEQACHLKAISFGPDLRAHINKDVCVNCGLCAKACQFGAITNRIRPCVTACKVKAISEREDGISTIDEAKCTRCGACSYACPFGAIMDKSFITKCIDIAKGEEKCYMIVAPSISSQFHYAKLEQVVTGIRKLGFDGVYEAALGADMVAYKECKELESKGVLTSSCCPAFVKYIDNSFPSLKDKVSHNLSPMAELGKFLKEKEPDAKIVFAGPCIAKKMEADKEEVKPYVDCVITFEELQALLDARDIDVSSLEPTLLSQASYYGRIFARSGGVSEAVAEALKEQGSSFEVKPMASTGLDGCRSALNQLKNGTNQWNFLEGMACVGGCIGGPCCLTHEVRDAADIDKYGKLSGSETIGEAIEKAK